MNAWDYNSLIRWVAARQLAPAKKLTVGQLRIAAVPNVIRPAREGVFDTAWLQPLATEPGLTQ